MISEKIKNKKICILGLGIENYALVKFLVSKNIQCVITICDARNEQELGNKYNELKNQVKWQLGENYNKNLKKFNIIMRAPGYPLFNPEIQKAKNYGVEISSPMKLFFEFCPTKNTIGVTGTKGKGTTSSLIHAILKESGKISWLVGNIGTAPFEFMDQIKNNDWVVLELSSFQLEDIDISPHIAVITNFYKEHLAPADPVNPNYHKTLNDYWNAKLNIIKWQNKKDKAVINKNLKPIISNYELKNKIIYFSQSELKSQLKGNHNKENIGAAVETTKIIGIKKDIIAKAIASFKGLEHRLKFVKKINEVSYYDDSFATTPESTIIALKSFKSPIVLLAGGAEKKSNFSELAKTIIKNTKFVVLLDGNATPKIIQNLEKIGYDKNRTKLVYNIKDAVKTAQIKAEQGDVVLLSPACASFGMFKNYKERGDLFKAEVKNLNKKL